MDDSPISGSSGRGDEDGLPAVGVSRRTATKLVRTTDGFPRVRLSIETREESAEAPNLIFEIPGETDEWVILSAHIDRHDLAESAIDNASGLAVALSVALSFSGPISGRRRGIRLILFNVE